MGTKSYAVGTSKPPTWRRRKVIGKVARVVCAFHSALYRTSRGRIAGSIGKMPVLLLTTTGRRSGRPTTTPLTYVKAGELMAVAASNGGMAWFPDWWLNLKANPEATVQVGSRKIMINARKASPSERAVLWPQFIDFYGGYAKYEQRTTREIPVVLLRPASVQEN
jgi:deazaflavin-dependent oxidoreductase (nitroreductase family)